MEKARVRLEAGSSLPPELPPGRSSHLLHLLKTGKAAVITKILLANSPQWLHSGEAMNVSKPDCGLTVPVPAKSLSSELEVMASTLTFPRNDLALTLSYSGRGALDCVTVIFPGDPKTVFIRDVFSDFPGRIVTFRRPAPRVAAIVLQTVAGPPRQPFTIHLRVSSPDLQQLTDKFGEDTSGNEVLVMKGPWPPPYTKNRTPRAKIDAFLESQISRKFKDKPELLKPKKFFLEYDHATHPLLLGANPILEGDDKTIRAPLVQKCLPILQQRVRMRGHCAMISGGRKVPTDADLAKVCLTSDEGGIDAPIEKAEVAYLSALQRDIIDSYFSKSKTDLTALQNAFIRFADGKLRDESSEGKTRMGQPTDASNGEPDSAHVFFFAEFACLAIEHKVDAKFWRALLPILAGIQRTYVNRYGGPPQRGSRGRFDEDRFNTYGPKGFDDGPDTIQPDNGRMPSHEGLLLKIGENILDAFGEYSPGAQVGRPSSYSSSLATVKS